MADFQKNNSSKSNIWTVVTRILQENYLYPKLFQESSRNVGSNGCQNLLCVVCTHFSNIGSVNCEGALVDNFGQSSLLILASCYWCPERGFKRFKTIRLIVKSGSILWRVSRPDIMNHDDMFCFQFLCWGDVSTTSEFLQVFSSFCKMGMHHMGH